ncbi:helix-turn-helix transcriptional regulator [Acidithiobacillus sulfuriphilus]|uniref:Uncharacterized protein n=1 Tax=Acidithiobacillus sulfuriphilus TaxID=1867749 RepID=A0ACD5HR87_9PROT|nr:hypothetical protein [Acidithiobacillus sulfuriphilus]
MTSKSKIPSFNASKCVGLLQFIFLCGVAILGFLVITHPFSLPMYAYYSLLGLCLICLALVIAVQLLLKGRFLDIRGVKAGWDSGDQWISPVRISRRIRRMHRAAFPAHLKQRGIVARDVTAARAQGRVQAARRPAGSGQKKKKTADSDGDGDGNGNGDATQHCTADVPPTFSESSYHRAVTVAHFLSYHGLAVRWSCSDKTIRNQVSAGKLPRPIQLPVGPRWPLAMIEGIESGRIPPVVSNTESTQPPHCPCYGQGGVK